MSAMIWRASLLRLAPPLITVISQVRPRERRRLHLGGGVEKQIRRRLPVRNHLGGEDASGEQLGQPGQRE
ncbi:hypothetical protein [Bosea sp. Root483D1]|uniref:hypothetical protein n=1 Tax=Bosea sp. Root483D1 TaxID=1736544 RepID=UPI001FCE0D3A|nr:hypothetical protein [Bosea sp. Root483D1]